MSEQCSEGFRCDPQDLQQAMAVHTRKITDSCRDKDCVEDLRVYLTLTSQQTLETAGNVRVRSAQLLYAYIDVQPVAFDRHHYCADITFYYRVLADGVVGTSRPTALTGLATFSKRAVLCGEDSRAHIFTSTASLTDLESVLATANLPTAVVEVLDPMVLGSKVTESTEGGETVTVQIPQAIRDLFDEELDMDGTRHLSVTLGQFSIVRLEREIQVLVPVVDYAIPTKECCDSDSCCTEDPCEVFSRIPFPTQQFSPQGCEQSCQSTP